MPAAPQGETASLAPLWVVLAYLALLLFASFAGRRLGRTSSEYFVASRSLGPFLLLMSIFGTTMTAFALVGSTGKAYELGIGVYGLMASSSGIVHCLVFFLVGVRLWAIGKRHDLTTQIQFLRARYDSSFLGYLVFPILVGLVVPYLLIGLIGAGSVVRGVTLGMFPATFPGLVDPATGAPVFVGSVPPWVTGLVVCGVVLAYVFTGGLRAAAWANAFQTTVFMTTGVIAFVLIARALGGFEAASRATLERAPELMARTGKIGHLQYLTYVFVPLSIAAFPHVFQHWLTARSARTFRTTMIAHPIFIMIVWAPCILIGVWAAGAGIHAPNPNAVLGVMVGEILHRPFVSGLLTAGILAAIMSSLDSQFLCLGTIFTHDVVLHVMGKERFTDRQKVAIGRAFIVLVVAATYVLSLFPPPRIFDLAVWCFSGFTGLFPLVLASVWWRRATKAGAIASVLTTAAVWSALFVRGLVRAPGAAVSVDGDYLVWGMLPVTVILASSAVVLVLVSLVTKPPPRALVDRFVFRPGSP